MKLIDTLKEFINRWYKRFKVFTHLFAIWAVIYSTINICNIKVAFEYNDGIMFLAKNKDSSIIEERTKILPSLLAIFMKFIGIKIDIIVDENDINPKKAFFVDEIYTVKDQNEKYQILENKKYLIFFSNSDEGIIQARKAQIIPIRIKRNPKSKNDLMYNPGNFNETILPLSDI